MKIKEILVRNRYVMLMVLCSIMSIMLINIKKYEDAFFFFGIGIGFMFAGFIENAKEGGEIDSKKGI